MERIKNQRVKISPRSITIKTEDGKTAGVVRNTCKFKELQINKQMEFFKILKASGIWGSGFMDGVVFHDGKLYYLHNLKPLEVYERYFASDPAAWEEETRRYNERKAAAEKMTQYCTVIPCYIMD